MLNDLGMAAAAVLAGTFAWAGAAKLSRSAQTAAGFAALGLGQPGALARIVPAVELALAVSLLAAPAVGAAAALVLLAAFSGVLLRALGRGVAVPCACFGQAGGPPLSYVDVVRNGLLGGLAVLATAAGLEPRVPRPPAILAVALVTFAGCAVVLLLRHRRRHAPGGRRRA